MPAQSEAHELADARLPRPGQVIAGKYRIDGFIARGGMGAVLSATHQVTGRRLALKWLLHDPGNDAEATHRLLREAQAAARVRHDNVVDVYDIGEHDGALFLVMELLEGDTLSAWLRERGKLDARSMLELLLPAMRGVEAAHRNHVLHRDLKPSNIFLCRTPDAPPHASQVTPRVLDFGISKIMSDAGDAEHSLTRTGAVLGTPQYMAKEQLTSEDVDERADVYALGVIMYQCLSGRLPFQDSNYNALVVQIATTTPTPVGQLAAGLPQGLEPLVMRAMAREPEARFRSVSALIEALLPFQNAAVNAPQAPRARWAWGVLLAAGLLVAILAWASSRSAPGVERPAPPHAPEQAVARPQPSPTTPQPPPPRSPAAPAAAPSATAATPEAIPAAAGAPAPAARDVPTRRARSHDFETKRDARDRPVPISPDQF